MSAPQITPPVSPTPICAKPPPLTGERTGPTRTAGRYVLAGSVLIALATGCQHNNGIGIQPVATGTSPTVATTTQVPTEQQAILAQYRTFWASLTTVSRMPAARRRTALQPYTTDPELKSLLAGMQAVDGKGQTFYGSAIPRATMAAVNGDGTRAVVNDCQDASRTGGADRKTGHPITVGVARNHVVVKMKKTADTWKVYFVSYSKTPC